MPTRPAPTALQSTGLRLPPGALPTALIPYVLDIYEEVIPAPSASPMRLAISATTTPTYNATLAGKARVEVGGQTFEMPREVLGGPQPEAYAAVVEVTVHGFYILFSPTGPLALFGTRTFWQGERPAPALPDVVRPSLRSEAAAFSTRVFAAPDFAARLEAALTFLQASLSTAPAADLELAAFLQRATTHIEAERGNVRVEALAQALGVSPPTLRRRFAPIGMPAKRFADIVRYRKAHAYLYATPGATWADAVYQFGYADQAHFVRDYRRFSGHSPTRWTTDDRGIDLRMGIENPDGRVPG